VKKPGAWNHYTITCKGPADYHSAEWTESNRDGHAQLDSGKTNPDGSEIPNGCINRCPNYPQKDYIGLQGKHAGAPVWFRNIRIREL
jgi:hypothetical protein